MSKLANHKWICAGLIALGYFPDVANVIAFRYLLGQTLFPNEWADADRVAKGAK